MATVFHTGHSDAPLACAVGGECNLMTVTSPATRQEESTTPSVYKVTAGKHLGHFFFFLILSKSDFKGGQPTEELDHLAAFIQRNTLSILPFFFLSLG